MTKRLGDVILSAVALVVLAPVLAVIGVSVVIESGRPVFFRQERIGRDGRPFELVKFRTMAPRPAAEVGPQITVAGDTRVTRVGGWLRSTKLDELPQLWNVLRGDMSLVGPRPEVPQYVALWPAEDKEIILSVRPGITDPASHRYRRESELLAAQPDPDAYYREVVLPDKVRSYRRYVNERTDLGDLKVLARTVQVVLLG